jgi:hypothetical protein
MALNSTGPISLGADATQDATTSIALELLFSRESTLDMNNSSVRGMLKQTTNNSEISLLQAYSKGRPFLATGGNTTVDSGGYRYHVFTSSARLNISQMTVGQQIEVLAVGPGGAGGNKRGGGGGAGGVVQGTLTLPNDLVGNYLNANIGAGGARGSGESAKGGNGSFGSTITDYIGREWVTCGAGGGGAGWCQAAGYGSNIAGSGGGGSNVGSGGCGAMANGLAANSKINGGGNGGVSGTGGTAGSGNGGGGGFTGDGGNSGSGPGASGTGGPGTSAYTTWTNAGGLASSVANGGAGGNTGGGSNGASGAANTGNGGGGGEGSASNVGGLGGSGFIIIRYAL